MRGWIRANGTRTGHKPFIYQKGQYTTPAALSLILQVCASCAPVIAEPVGISDPGLIALQVAPEINVAVYGHAGPFQEAGVWNGSTVTQYALPGPCEQLTPGALIFLHSDFCVSNGYGISRNGRFVAGATPRSHTLTFDTLCRML